MYRRNIFVHSFLKCLQWASYLQKSRTAVEMFSVKMVPRTEQDTMSALRELAGSHRARPESGRTAPELPTGPSLASPMK